MTTTKTRYRSPTRTAEAEVGLDEFDTHELERELASRGGLDVGEPSLHNDGVYLDSEFINSVNTLLLCGQKQSARDLVSDKLFDVIGRRL